MAKKVQGRKWQIPIKVKNKNCYNLSDVDTILKGEQATEKYNRYRAVFNAVIGGSTSKKIPAIGSFELEEKDKVSIKNITKLLLAKDFVVIFRGNSKSVIKLNGIQSIEGVYFNKDIELKKIRQSIQELEKVEDVNAAKQVSVLAGIYRDMLSAKEKTAPNEKKTMIDVLVNNLCMFSNIDEVVLLADTFLEVPITSGLSRRISSVYPDYIEVLKAYSLEELNKEIAGFLSLKKKLDTKEVNLEKLQAISIISGNVQEKVRSFNTDSTTFTEYANSVGLDVKLVHYNVEKQLKDVEVVNKDDLDLSKEKEIIALEIEKVIDKWGRYNRIIAIGQTLYDNANTFEQNLWVKEFTTANIKRAISEEFEYLRNQANSNKGYTTEIPLGAFKSLYVEHLGKEDKFNALHNLKVLAPKGSKDDRHTPNSLGWDLDTKVGLRTVRKAITDLDIFVDNVIDVLNAVIYCSLAEFLTRFGVQGIIFTNKMVGMLKDNEDFPFVYTKGILEGANRCFRAERGLARGVEDTENILGAYSDWVKQCILFLNSNAEPLKETDNKQEVQEIIYKQICLIFEQYKKYLMIE